MPPVDTSVVTLIRTDATCRVCYTDSPFHVSEISREKNWNLKKRLLGSRHFYVHLCIGATAFVDLRDRRRAQTFAFILMLEGVPRIGDL